MTTLITGGTGFIGSNLARMLIDKGERPVLLDVAPVQGMLRDMESEFDYVRGSLTNLPELINCMKQYGVHRVSHLGGICIMGSDLRLTFH
jgi:nucleoside-diphosphate-sugar epimerase